MMIRSLAVSIFLFALLSPHLALGEGPPPNVVPSDNSAGNTAGGTATLGKNTIGQVNTGFGYRVLYENTTGFFNSGFGAGALLLNTTGVMNSGFGFSTLMNTSIGDWNSASGAYALWQNTTGYANTASGFSALVNNKPGTLNTADGAEALRENITGNYNTASGAQSLLRLHAGSQNTALGFRAGMNLTSGSNNIYIASPGIATESDTIRIGHQQPTLILPPTLPTMAGTPLVIDGNGQVGRGPNTTQTLAAQVQAQQQQITLLTQQVAYLMKQLRKRPVK
jgi:hypothetical protein